MSIDPLIEQLTKLRRQRLWLAVGRGVILFLSVVLSLLAIACYLDYRYDRIEETPLEFRAFLTAFQVIFALGLITQFYRNVPRPRFDQLAEEAESAFPEFSHRLVTALQLHDKSDREGVSESLLALLTRRAAATAERVSLPSLVSYQPLVFSLIPLTLVLGSLGIFTLFQQKLVTALVLRQALLDVEIPRAHSLVNQTPEVQALGEDAVIRIEVLGPDDTAREGVVTFSTPGRPDRRLPLKFLEQTEGSTIRTALLPDARSGTFTATLHGARLRPHGKLRCEARPTVKSLRAVAIAPLWFDPEGKKRYEKPFDDGDVLLLPDSTIRYTLEAVRPLTRATLIPLVRRESGEADLARIPMTLSEDQTVATISWNPAAGVVGVRFEAEDATGLSLAASPQRSITMLPNDPPRVTLLPEILKDPNSLVDPGPIDDYDVTGMPATAVGRVPIAWSAHSPLGIARVRLLYRVNEGNWTQFPLTPVTPDLTKVGPFVPDLGLFLNSGRGGNVECYFLPSTEESAPSGLTAGGRYDFRLAGITKLLRDGTRGKLEPGDRIEFQVEADDRYPAPGRPAGKSTLRAKTIVDSARLRKWLEQWENNRERLKGLEERQRGVFE